MIIQQKRQLTLCKKDIKAINHNGTLKRHSKRYAALHGNELWIVNNDLDGELHIDAQMRECEHGYCLTMHFLVTVSLATVVTVASAEKQVLMDVVRFIESSADSIVITALDIQVEQEDELRFVCGG